MVETHSFTISKNTSKVIIALMIVVICFVGCSKPIDYLIPNYTIVDNKIEYVEDWLESVLKKEYSNYVVGQKTTGVFDCISKKETYNAYVLVSPIDSNHVCHDVVLAVETDDYVYFIPQPEDVPSYADSIYACDVDGDRTEEIILQQTIGMTGGAGQYLSRVYKIKNGDVIEMLASSTLNAFDTGFEYTAKDDYKVEVQNRFITFDRVYDIKGLKGIGLALYNENGKRNETTESPYVDSFFSFKPFDVDSDGVFELECKQYVALCDHSNYLGTSVSVIKYNNTTEKFEVVQADFILEQSGDGSVIDTKNQ